MLVLLMWGAAGDAGADQEDSLQPEVPLEELFQTEVVYPQEKGEIQVTMTTRVRRVGETTAIEVPLTLEYGLTDAWQIELEWGGFESENEFGGGTERGTGSLEIGVKYSFMDEEPDGFHQALGFSLDIPIEHPRADVRVLEYRPFVVLAKDLPRRTQLFAELACSLVQALDGSADGDDETESHQVALNVGGFVALPGVVLTGEINWASELEHPGRANELYATPGIVRRQGKYLELGVGVPVGLTSDSDRFRVLVQATIEF